MTCMQLRLCAWPGAGLLCWHWACSVAVRWQTRSMRSRRKGTTLWPCAHSPWPALTVFCAVSRRAGQRRRACAWPTAPCQAPGPAETVGCVRPSCSALTGALSGPCAQEAAARAKAQPAFVPEADEPDPMLHAEASQAAFQAAAAGPAAAPAAAAPALPSNSTAEASVAMAAAVAGPGAGMEQPDTTAAQRAGLTHPGQPAPAPSQAAAGEATAASRQPADPEDVGSRAAQEPQEASLPRAGGLRPGPNAGRRPPRPKPSLGAGSMAQRSTPAARSKQLQEDLAILQACPSQAVHSIQRAALEAG